MRMQKYTIPIKRVLLIAAAVLLVVLCVAGCGAAGSREAARSEGLAESSFRRQLSDSQVTEVEVSKDLVLEAPLELSGSKVLYGEGSITAVGSWAEGGYMLVVPAGASLTVKGNVTVDAAGIAGGIHAAQGGSWSLEETATVKNAARDLANTLVEGTFRMTGGTLAEAKGANVIVKGEMTQDGGVIRDGYDNVVVHSGGSFQFFSGENQESRNDGIVVYQGGKLTTTSKKAVVFGSGGNGIYVAGDAVVESINLSASANSLLKVTATGTLELEGGTLADAGYHGVENAGTMKMTGGNIRASYSCGIVNSGTLELTGGIISDNANNKGLLNRHNGKALVSGAAVMFSGNRYAIANQDTAHLELTGAEILLTSVTNVYAYEGTVNIHDINLGASGSNNVRIYNAQVTMNNVQVLGNSASGSSSTHGILLEGGQLQAADVTIKNCAGYGIRNKGGSVTAQNLTIDGSSKAGGISSNLQDHTGKGGQMVVSNLTIQGIRYNNLVVEGGQLTITDGILAPSGTNNVKVTAGVLELSNVDVQGNQPDVSGTNHAVYVTGGTLKVQDVKVRSGKFSGLRVDGDTAVVEGKNLSIDSCGEYGINQTRGSITLSGLTMQENYYNITNRGGTISLSDSTLGGTISNNVRIYDGKLKLQNVTVAGHRKGHIANVHALFVSGGELTGQNVTVKSVSNVGLRVAAGSANIRGLTVADAGKEGVWVSDGSATLQNLVVKKATGTGVSVTGTGRVTLSGGTISGTDNHAIKATENGTVKMVGTQVTMPAIKDRHGILAEGGDVHLENVTIRGNASNTVGGGIRINRATSQVTGKNITISDVNIGITASDGTCQLSGVKTENLAGHSVLATGKAVLTLSDSTFGISGTNNVKAESGGQLILSGIVVEGTKTNHALMVEKTGSITGKDITVLSAASSAVRVKTSDGGGYVELDGLTVTNAGGRNLWISRDANAGKLGHIVVKNGDLGVSTTHNVHVEAGSVTLVDTTVRGHVSGTANNVHAIYSCTDAEAVKLENVTVTDAAGDALRVGKGQVEAVGFTAEKTGRNGVWVDGGSLTAENMTLTNSQYGIQVTGSGKADFTGITVTDHKKSSLLVTGTQVTIRGYADGQPSQLGKVGGDNITANGGGVIRMEKVQVLTAGANNIVATDGKVYLTDSTVTGGGYSVLAQSKGYAELTNVTISDPVKDGIRVNAQDGLVKATDVQILEPVRYGISAEKGTVELSGKLSISSTAGKGSALCVYNGGKLQAAEDATVTLTGMERGILAESDATVTLSNVLIDKCATNGVKVTGGKVTLGGATVTGSTGYHLQVTGGELVVNPYRDGKRSQVGSCPADNIRSEGTGIIRLNQVDVASSSKNNVVAITGGTVYLTDTAVTGGSHSVLADQDGKVYLTRVTIRNSTNSGIRANHTGSLVSATDVQIDGANLGLSIKSGNVTVEKLTIRNAKNIAVDVRQGTAVAKVTLTDLTVENAATHAFYTSGADARLTVKGATILHSGADHAINLNGGPMVLQDVSVNSTALGADKYDLYSGAGWLTIGGAMDVDIHIATNPGRVIKVNKALSGNRLTVDWQNAPTGNALEFTDEAMAQASQASVVLGPVQSQINKLAYTGKVATLKSLVVSNLVTSEAELQEYLAYAQEKGMTEATVLVGGSFQLTKPVTVPASITSVIFQDDGNTATGNEITYTGTADGCFAVAEGRKLTVKGIQLTATQAAVLLQLNGGELTVQDAVLTVTDPSGWGIRYDSGALKLAGNVTATLLSKNLPISVTSELTGNLTVDWTTAPTGNVITFPSEAVMTASKDNLHLGSIQGANSMLVFEGGAAKLMPCLTVTGWQDLAQKVTALTSGSKMTYKITGGAAAWAAGSTITVPAGADVTVLADGASPAIVVASGVSPFAFGENSRLTLENVTIGGTASAKAAHIVLPKTAVLTLNNATLQYFSGAKGGAVHVNAGTLLAQGASFIGNDSTDYGGAIGIWGGTAELTNTTFRGNTSKLSGGAVMNFKADSFSLGGTKDGTLGQLTVTGCVFTENKSAEHGGAIGGWSGGQITVTGSVFGAENDATKGNTATKNGGAIHVQDSHKLSVSDSQFYANIGGASSLGGAIYLKTSSPASVSGCSFTGNEAQHGGAINTELGGLVTITNSTFRDNRTSGEGGALRVVNNISVTGCSFQGNRAAGNGGAVLVVKPSQAATRTFTDCTFTENSGAQGGAISIATGQSMTLHNITCKDNTTTGAFGTNTTWGYGDIRVADYNSAGELKISGKMVATIWNNQAHPVKIVGELTEGSDLTIDWRLGKLSANKVGIIFSSQAIMNASKPYIHLGIDATNTENWKLQYTSASPWQATLVKAQ